MSQKNSLSLPVSMVVPTEKALIESALPSGYRLKGRLGGKYAVCTGLDERCIGTAAVENGQVVFVMDNDNFGNWFLRKLKEKYPGCDNERVVWAIFFEWHGKWSMLGRPTLTKEESLKGLSYFHLQHRPLMCSFYAKDSACMEIMTLTTQRIDDSWRVSDIDEGPTMIELTNQESSLETLTNEELIKPEDLDLI